MLVVRASKLQDQFVHRLLPFLSSGEGHAAAKLGNRFWWDAPLNTQLRKMHLLSRLTAAHALPDAFESHWRQQRGMLLLEHCCP